MITELLHDFYLGKDTLIVERIHIFLGKQHRILSHSQVRKSQTQYKADCITPRCMLGNKQLGNLNGKYCPTNTIAQGLQNNGHYMG